MKTSEKASMIISIRLPRRYCSDGVSTAEASKGVLNGERRVARSDRQPDTQASVFSLANFRIFRVHSITRT